MMQKDLEEEINLVHDIIIHSSDFELSCGFATVGLLHPAGLLKPAVWMVEWTEYHNPHSDEKYIYEGIEFEDPKLAAACFVDLWHKASEQEKQSFGKLGYYLLGSDLEDFKKKWESKKEGKLK